MNDERVHELLRGAVPRIDVSLERDLWQRMERRLQPATPMISRLDWALIAAVLASMVVFPESILALLYHL